MQLIQTNPNEENTNAGSSMMHQRLKSNTGIFFFMNFTPCNLCLISNNTFFSEYNAPDES